MIETLKAILESSPTAILYSYEEFAEVTLVSIPLSPGDWSVEYLLFVTTSASFYLRDQVEDNEILAFCAWREEDEIKIRLPGNVLVFTIGTTAPEKDGRLKVTVNPDTFVVEIVDDSPIPIPAPSS